MKLKLHFVPFPVLTVVGNYPSDSSQANAKNTCLPLVFGLILINKEKISNTRMAQAIWLQEFYECKHRLNPINALKYFLSDSARRDMEVMGHEIEVQHMGAGFEYRRNEAQSLMVNYPQFYGFYVDSIIDMMLNRSAEAIVFTDAHVEKASGVIK